MSLSPSGASIELKEPCNYYAKRERDKILKRALKKKSKNLKEVLHFLEKVTAENVQQFLQFFSNEIIKEHFR